MRRSLDLILHSPHYNILIYMFDEVVTSRPGGWRMFDHVREDRGRSARRGCVSVGVQELVEQRSWLTSFRREATA